MNGMLCMEDSQFDRFTQALASGQSRRSAIKIALGLGGIAALGGRAPEADAARRPTPTPKPVKCPGNQTWDGSACVCPDGDTKCGPDCCPDGQATCCDNACCYGTCSSEEICCSTGEIPCGKNCCGTGTRCVHGNCFDDPCRTIGEPCAVNGDCCGVDAYAVCEFSESQGHDVCAYSSLT